MSTHSLFDLTNRTALITGGSGVLGRAMARGLAEAGATVVIMGRRQELCDAAVAELRSAGHRAFGVSCDVTDGESLERAAQTVEAQIGVLDILVNAAGGNRPAAIASGDRTFFDLDPAATDAIIQLNLQGTILPSQIFGKVMAQRGEGCIINISSMAALRPLTRVLGYSVAKAAVSNFTQWLAVHLAHAYGPRLRVNALAPGFFLTEFNLRLLTNPEEGTLTPRGQDIINHTPMGRFGKPEELIGTLVWLCSPAAAFVTGIVVPVDGGFSAFAGV